MPLVALCASSSVRLLLEPLLQQKGWVVSEQADVTLVERGMPIPERGLVILFGPGIATPEAEWLARLTLAGAGAPARPYLVGRHGDRIHLVEHGRIRFIRAEGDDVLVDTCEGSFRIAERLYEVETALRAEGFVRIGKSLVVNIAWIAEIIPWLGYRLLLKIKDGNEELEVARKYVKAFREYLGIGT